jgi:hypothetical protein
MILREKVEKGIARYGGISRRRNSVKERSNMKSLSTDSKDNTKVNRWWPRITGAVLGVLFVAVWDRAGGMPPISTITMLIGVFAVIVIAFFWKGIDGVIFVRWWARTMGVIVAAVLGYIIIGESVGGQGPGVWSLESVPWMVVFVGIVIAFFWEGIGGMLVALAALAIQINVIVTLGGDLWTILQMGWNPYILGFVFFGLASVYCWWRTRRLSLTHQPET